MKLLLIIAPLLVIGCKSATSPTNTQAAGIINGSYYGSGYEGVIGQGYSWTIRLDLSTQGDSIKGTAVSFSDNFQTVYARGVAFGKLLNGDTLAHLIFAVNIPDNQGGYSGELYAIRSVDTLQYLSGYRKLLFIKK